MITLNPANLPTTTRHQSTNVATIAAIGPKISVIKGTSLSITAEWRTDERAAMAKAATATPDDIARAEQAVDWRECLNALAHGENNCFALGGWLFFVEDDASAPGRWSYAAECFGEVEDVEECPRGVAPSVWIEDLTGLSPFFPHPFALRLCK